MLFIVVYCEGKGIVIAQNTSKGAVIYILYIKHYSTVNDCVMMYEVNHTDVV